MGEAKRRVGEIVRLKARGSRPARTKVLRHVEADSLECVACGATWENRPCACGSDAFGARGTHQRLRELLLRELLAI